MRSGGAPSLAPTHAASSSGSSGSSSGHGGGGGGLSFERFSAVFAAAPDLGALETARELLGRAASSKRAFAALKQGNYQLRAAWGATGSSVVFGSGCGQALPGVPRKAPLCS